MHWWLKLTDNCRAVVENFDITWAIDRIFQYQFNIYTVSQKKNCATFIFTVILSNDGRFLKFFQCRNQKETAYNKNKCKKRSLSHQLTAQLHIENSKNDKGYITKQHADILTRCCFYTVSQKKTVPLLFLL